MQEKKKLWNTSVKCTQEFNPRIGTTLNKIYKIEDGRLTYDNGRKSMNEFANIEELNRGNAAKFVELKKRGRQKKAKAESTELEKLE